MNWDDILPPETDEAFYSSTNVQIDFVRHSLPSIDTIRAIAAIFRISNTIYDQLFPPRHRHPPAQLPSIPVAKPERPRLFLKIWKQDFSTTSVNPKTGAIVCARENAGSCSPRNSRPRRGQFSLIGSGGTDSSRAIQNFPSDHVTHGRQRARKCAGTTSHRISTP
jgi:hypothetical protein